VLYLALHQIGKKWTMPIRDKKQAMSQSMILLDERLEQSLTATYTENLQYLT
jgi:transposase-like protein